MTTRIDFKSQERSLRKQMVLDTAVKIFGQKGYRAATLDDVARELGVSKPALYHYFSSKEKLLSEIYLQSLGRMFKTIYEVGKMDLSPPEKMRVLVRRHLKEVVIGNLDMFLVFFSEENELPEKEFEKIRREKIKFTKVVMKIIEEGIDQGYFRRLDSMLLADAIIGMCNWLYRWYKPGTNGFTPDQIADQFIGLLENGYMEQPSEGRKTGKEGGGRHAEARKMDRKRRLLKELKKNLGDLGPLIEELEMLI